ncbi:UDP-N-acetylmuramate dehydrogenase [Nesterenkonia muleiensis]|uniref:UDP-N-acetylmuramate dehydrogenase n=1 Tax=Nesterenkonia muleiensis TaxID=2282648 RepID=UPI001EE4DE42|nr:UDP-N-acetylmuramate dehydrogenase [Nesterenkonia muleiensis]
MSTVNSGQPKRLRDYTTARVGGPAAGWVVAHGEDDAVDELRAHPLPSESARSAGQDTLLVLGGGSNLLVSDEGFSGTVLQLAFDGISAEPVNDDEVDLTVAAGHHWDAVVAWTVERGLVGLEALSGIPGAAGAVPVQNVGAYGAEVAQTIVEIRAWDREAQDLVVLSNQDLRFSYRDSLLKRTTVQGSPRYVVLSVRLRLTHQQGKALSAPVRYAELARSLGLDAEADGAFRRAPLAEVRQKVLQLRAGKGMVLDPEDHDTWSTGSFFTNPILPESELPNLMAPSLSVAGLPEGAPRFPAGENDRGEALVKLSAAWLIDRAGCGKGFGLPEGPEAGRGADGAGLAGGRASLSTKHTLAVTNRGDASAEDLLTVARAARHRVRETFGVTLHPEPVLIGCRL